MDDYYSVYSSSRDRGDTAGCSGDADYDEDDDSDDDDAFTALRKKNIISKCAKSSTSKRKKTSSKNDPFSEEFDVSTTDFNPDTAKNTLQQYHQKFIHPSTTPTYVPKSARAGGFASEVQFYVTRGGKVICITGYGQKKADSEKNAALRACVYLERNSPMFQALSLPANARVRCETSLFGTPSTTSSVHGLTELNSACFLMHCVDTGSLANVRREPNPDPSGGFRAITRIFLIEGRSLSFKSDNRMRKQEAQNEADLRAAVWVYKNLGVRVPARLAA